ncbi:3-hydroxyacyl-CoA dehydrogenase NAD-binding domain-containing protein [Catellatospora sp. KI3]|uniref:3-hydroxyacyl-CoA dehydrogenase NAD-binding domain-containing protein n=1 Tax=Catellatospora sp. KI3 TaxID=3041620 RepID=UPI002482DD8A|nr:3-hydroxyacyl-CoA dehydrogenase NAD-binding domain-containing protein [Catellatospora sp. KI3]MDI1463047.1 3-hydroxyacyl-CoA dehydrogenase NAD-binding domain-containing protein [Catellatospora sp. KI3]
MISYELGADGVVTLTMDDPEQSANTMNDRYVTAMGAALDRLEADRDRITGVIVTSAKSTFFAGGDLDLMVKAQPEDASALTELVNRIKHDLRRLEKLGRPVVAAVNGSALGGGLEIALACHHRVVLDAKGCRLGLPEVTLGLLPGAGGVTRTVRMLGLAPALMNVLLTGRQFRPADAKVAGLADEVVSTPEAMFAAARAWIAANPGASQPWDRKGFRIPGGGPNDPKVAVQLPAYAANLRKQLKGASLPAPEAILATAVEGALVDVDTATLIETRYLVSLLTGQIAKNMIGALFFDLKAVNSGANRPQLPPTAATRVAVLGAGMMGAGIAYVCAKAGLDVLLKDMTLEAAAKGRGYSEKLVAGQVAKGRLSAEAAAALLDRITPTADAADLAGCDVVIEAVFEDLALKHRVLAEVSAVVGEGALLASNTSTLPITQIAEPLDRPGDVVGMHFFSPVDKMPLLEIVVGAQTGDAAIARAFDLGRLIGKTPIVVNDSRGFFTSRVIGTFIEEAITMVAEGVPPASIEHAALQAGYPTGPLALADEVTLTLMQRIRRSAQAAGQARAEVPAHALIDALVDAHTRPGRSGGAGFYEYADGRRAGLWSGLAAYATEAGRAVPIEDIKDRMLFVEAIESRRCLDEGVLRSEADGNIGSILGIGYPAWTGGVLRFIAQHPDFPGRAAELADRYGDRFRP